MKALNIHVSKGKYNLTTKARQAFVGIKKQLDKGTGRQSWKCHDLLNCVALVAFRKHDTWVQIWHMGANMDLEFSGTLHKSAITHLALALGLIALCRLLKSAWLVNPQTQKHAVLNVTSIVLLGLLFA